MGSRRSIPSWPCGCWAKSMKQGEMLAALRLRLPDAAAETDALLSGLLEDAGALIRALTWREETPAGLENAQVRLGAAEVDGAVGFSAVLRLTGGVTIQ